MSFLNELKSQAGILKSQQAVVLKGSEQSTAMVEGACRIALHYLDDLARQLNVIGPAAPRFSLDGKVVWPAMKLTSFCTDSRKKTLRDREVFDHITLGWQVLPQVGPPVGGVVSVNFPPDLERVESRLASGWVKHEREEVRHADKNTLLAVRFAYLTKSRGNVTLTPDHDSGQIAFRLLNTAGFGVIKASWPADQINSGVLDELAKLIVSQPSRFV